ncbi:MAG: hypothetical protein QM533_11550 [Cytophagales bacterium]|nr:hypothetical protein [Cytophagales bacterium]
MTAKNIEATYVTHQELEAFREMVAIALEKAYSLFEGQATYGQTHLAEVHGFLDRIKDMQHDPLK